MAVRRKKGQAAATRRQKKRPEKRKRASREAKREAGRAFAEERDYLGGATAGERARRGMLGR